MFVYTHARRDANMFNCEEVKCHCWMSSLIAVNLIILGVSLPESGVANLAILVGQQVSGMHLFLPPWLWNYRPVFVSGFYLSAWDLTQAIMGM